jgi:hypothetical protein
MRRSTSATNGARRASSRDRGRGELIAQPRLDLDIGVAQGDATDPALRDSDERHAERRVADGERDRRAGSTRTV